jgi:hypothetical protein
MQKNMENILLAQKTRPPHRDLYEKSSVPLAHDERRVHKRINIKMMAKINQATARLCNISKGGMKLATPTAYEGPNVHVTLDTGEKIFDIKGIIRWMSSKRSFSNLIDFGVEITEAPLEYFEFIDQLLANK